MPPPSHVDELARHTEFLRALARRLVGEARADDVVQDAFVAALEHPPARRGALRTWLARVVHNTSRNAQRGELRRGAREAQVARTEALPASEDSSERIEIARLTLEAVQALPREARELVYRRFWEGHSVAQLAEEESLSQDAVRGRLRRALDSLRVDLDRLTGGDRTRWTSALLPLTRLETPVAVAAPFLVMKKIAALLALALVALIGSWSLGFLEPEAPAALELSSQAQELTQPEEDEVVPVLAGGSPDTDRRAQTTDASRAESPARLRVEVVWEDRAAATGILVLARALGTNAALPERAVSDEAGVALFMDPPRGETALRGFRGGEQHVSVGSTGTTVTRLVIPRGIDVLGRVTAPDGSPVAGAEVWVSGASEEWPGAHDASRSNAHGEFTLQALPETFMLGARAQGYGASLVERLETRRIARGEPARIELVLQPDGGSLEGLVTDAEGRPVAGARVLIGRITDHGQRADGTYERFAPPPALETDTDGRFEARGLPTGMRAVFVDADGFAAFHQETEIVAGESRSLRIELSRGVLVTGRVSHAGAPLAGVEVRLDRLASGLRYASAFPAPSTRSALDGTYRLGPLPPGRLALVATHDAPAARATTTLAADNAEELEWSPTLVTEALLSGRVIDNEGAPLAGWRVVAQPSDPATLAAEAQRVRVAESDVDGRFQLRVASGCRLAVQATQPLATNPHTLRAEDVDPSAGELVLQLDQRLEEGAFVTGRFHDAAGIVPEQARVFVVVGSMVDEFARAEIQSDTFRVGPIPPGPAIARVALDHNSLWASGPLELVAGEDHDLGTIVTEARGSLVIELERGPGFDRSIDQLMLVAADLSTMQFQGLTTGSTHGGRTETLENHELAPGSYRVMVIAEDVVCVCPTLVVEPGGTTRGNARLSRGHARTLRVQHANGAIPGKLKLLLTDESGEVFLEYEGILEVEDRAATITLAFPVGETTVVVSSPEGLRASGKLLVQSDGRGPEGLTLELP